MNPTGKALCNKQLKMKWKGRIPKEGIAEIKVSMRRSPKKFFLRQLIDGQEIADFCKSLYPKGEIELRESFYVVYMNTKNIPIGYYKLSTGGNYATIVDTKGVLAPAILGQAASIILCHNHPSSIPTPSQEDVDLTENIMLAGLPWDIFVYDHVIICSDCYHSFREKGEMEEITTNNPILGASPFE